MDPLSHDIFIRTAYLTALSAAAFIVILIFLITTWRAATRVRFQRFERIRTKWLETLEGARTTIDADLRHLSRDAAFLLMHQWNAVFDGSRITSGPSSLDASQEQLRVAGDKVRMEEFALELLEVGTNEELVSACVALGNLRASRAWIPLRRRSASEDQYVSAAAAEALVRIDSVKAVPHIIDGIHRHLDWPDHVVSRILSELPESALHDVIRGVVGKGNFRTTLNTFGALDRMNHPMAIVLLEWLFARAKTEDSLIQCAYAAFQEDNVRQIAQRLAYLDDDSLPPSLEAHGRR